MTGAPDAREVFARGGVEVTGAPDARVVFARGGVEVTTYSNSLASS